MSNKFFWVIIVSVIIIIGIGLALLSRPGFQPISKTDSGANNQLVNGAATKAPAVREFKINAFKYDYDPNVITAKRGETVKIAINNTDVIHGIRIPELGISGNDFVEFTAEKTGEFTWYCNNYCGDGHGQMQGKLIVQ